MANPTTSARWPSVRTVVLTIALACLAWAGAASGRTVMDSKPARLAPAVSGVVHRQFDAGTVTPAERLVLLVEADDGVVVSVNGHEVGRFNVPAGPVGPQTLAERAADKDRGIYYRVRLPADVLRPGENTVDAEVHSATDGGSALACDLEVKTLPTLRTQPDADDAAKRVLELFRKTSYLPAGTLIPDGYVDGGHGMRLDGSDHATSSREILVVDRPADPELQHELAYARTLRGLPPLDRAHKLSVYVDQLSTPPAGRKVLDDTVTFCEHEFKNKPLCIGDFIDQCHAGVCRHRSLLFKLLGDEAGLRTALVRGNYFHAGHGDPHAWNEVVLDDGRRYLIDSTQRPNEAPWEITTPAVTPATVVHHYVKLDDTPYYGPHGGPTTLPTSG
jgi:hypothetical protein